MKQYFGKYRGTVSNNIDPKRLGRIQVSVASVLGQGQLSWAMPSVPFAGPSMGFYAIPPIGANVWVEFEEGDSGKPIWSGCFWDELLQSAPISSPTDAAQIVVIKTLLSSITLHQLPGTGSEVVTIEALPAFKIEIKQAPPSIEITNGAGSIKIELTKVSINQDGLEVLF